MSLTVGQLERDVAQVLYGAKLEGGDLVRYVNEAGHALHALHDWEWAKGREATVKLTAGKDLAPLPNDCASIVALRRPGTYVRRVEFVSVERIQTLQGTAGVNSGWYYAAIRSLPLEGDPSQEPEPQLYLYPTPSDDDELLLLYRSDWPELRSDNDICPLPNWMHTVFRAIFRAVVLGYEEFEQATVDQRLEGVRSSAMFQTTVNKDSANGASLGRVRGGAARSARRSSSHYGFGHPRVYPLDYDFCVEGL